MKHSHACDISSLCSQATRSVAAPTRLQWAAGSLCPLTPQRRTDCLKRLLRALLLLSPARPPRRSRLLPPLPPAHLHTAPPTEKIRESHQTAPPPLTSRLPLPGSPLRSLRLSRLPPCPPPRPLYSLQWRSLSTGTQLPPSLLQKSQDLPPEHLHPLPPSSTLQWTLLPLPGSVDLFREQPQSPL